MPQTRILLVEDSDIFAELFAFNAQSSAGIELVGRARDGVEGVALAASLQPDVILMDVQMPRKNGIDAAREIRASSHVPILVMSGVGKSEEASMCFDAVKAGATDFVAKPSDEREFRRLVSRLKLVASSAPASERQRVKAPVAAHKGAAFARPAGTIDIVAVASSTGGPAALAALLPQLPASFPAPIVIVQHMSDGFEQNLVDWLDKTTGLRVTLADAGGRPQRGNVYIARPGSHLVFDRNRVLRVDAHTPPREGHSPSGSVLFHSMVRPFGAECLAVVLTGMGDDGSDGLLALRNAGATTLAQDSASSTIDGMPKAARENGAAMYVRPLNTMADALQTLVRSVKGASSPRINKRGA